MKRLFTTLLLLAGFTAVASAQSSFNVSATEVWTVAPHQIPDVEGHFTITNTTNAMQTIRWERTIVDITNGCESQVCDINLCYTPFVSTRTFDLDAGASGAIIMHFLNWDSIVGASSVIRLKMSNVNIASDTVTVTYLFTSPLAGTDNPLPTANVKVYPNPTAEYFQLENADAVRSIRMLALDSREVARFTANPGEQYSVAQQPAGTYILILEDQQGRAFQAAEIVKR
ncbi:MAG: T9SS type A sorting domain-containing protein [Lewinellaceae bacterium]|nr:T9SS type A sorting domain-containing protein [Lewinellaceae bacterium]